jgi:tetratricopeptide (TPR) repeat protein
MPDQPDENQMIFDLQQKEFQKKVQEFQLAAAAAQSAFDWKEAISCYTEVLDLAQAAPPGAVSFESVYSWLDNRAACYKLTSDNSNLELDLKRMRELAEAQGDLKRSVAAFIRWLEVLCDFGRVNEALQQAETELLRIRQSSEPGLEAGILARMSFIFGFLSNYARSQECGERALQLYREQEDLGGQSDVLRNLSSNYSKLGQVLLAQTFGEQSLEIARLSGDRSRESKSLNSLAITSPDYARQRDYEEQAQTILESIGALDQQMFMLNNLGSVYAALGLYSRARDYLERSINHSRKVNWQSQLSYSLDSLVRVLFYQGDLDRARQLAQEGEILAKELGDPTIIAIYWLDLGRIAYLDGNLPEARDFLIKAMQLLESVNSSERVNPMGWLGLTYLALGDLQNALSITKQAEEALRALGNVFFEFPPQEAWWSRYLVLSARDTQVTSQGQGISEEAWDALDNARSVMLIGIVNLSDEGLRRNYLNKVSINRQIIQETGPAQWEAPDGTDRSAHG